MAGRDGCARSNGPGRRWLAWRSSGRRIANPPCPVMMPRVGRADMWKWFAVAALVLVTGCADRQVASCATPMNVGTVGPCWDGTDRTDRTSRDDLTDRT